MIRNLVALLALGLTGVALAGEPPQVLPQGTWRKAIDDDSSWTLTLHGKGAKWVGHDPKGMTATWVAPICVLAEDGKTAYGYMSRMTFVKGTESADSISVEPYAFTFKVDGDSLEITDFKVTGLDPKWFPWLTGTFSKVPPAETAQKESSTVER